LPIGDYRPGFDGTISKGLTIPNVHIYGAGRPTIDSETLPTRLVSGSGTVIQGGFYVSGGATNFTVENCGFDTGTYVMSTFYSPVTAMSGLQIIGDEPVPLTGVRVDNVISLGYSNVTLAHAMVFSDVAGFYGHNLETVWNEWGAVLKGSGTIDGIWARGHNAAGVWLGSEGGIPGKDLYLSHATIESLGTGPNACGIDITGSGEPVNGVFISDSTVRNTCFGAVLYSPVPLSNIHFNNVSFTSFGAGYEGIATLGPDAITNVTVTNSTFNNNTGITQSTTISNLVVGDTSFYNIPGNAISATAGNSFANIYCDSTVAGYCLSGGPATVSAISGSPALGLFNGTFYGDSSGVSQVTENAPTVVGSNFEMIGTFSNLLKYSQFDSGNAAWIQTCLAYPLTFTYGQTDPLGGTTAVKMVSPATSCAGSGPNSGSQLNQDLTATIISGQPYTLSVWAKGNSGGEYVRLDLFDVTTAHRWQDTSNVILTTAWQHIPFSVIPTFTSGDTIQVEIGSLLPSQTITFWGAQLEQASSVGGYIQTEAAAVPLTQGVAATAIYDTSILSSTSLCTNANGLLIPCSSGPGTGTVTTSGSPASPNIAAFSSSTAITAATSADIQTAIGAGVYDASGAAGAITLSGLGAGTAATHASTDFLLATGATTGATSQIQQFNMGIGGPYTSQLIADDGAGGWNEQINTSSINGYRWFQGPAFGTQLMHLTPTTGILSTLGGFSGSVNGVSLSNSGASTSYLDKTGNYSTPAGAGTVTTSGSPVSPNIAAFSSSTAITAATSANIQTAIGAGVYDASGAAAARAAVGSCSAGQYGTATTTSGLTCAQVAYSQVSGNPETVTLATGTDLNTVVRNGWYDGYQLVNAPTALSSTFAKIFVITADDTGLYVTQLAYYVVGSDTSWWMRISTAPGPSWSAWVQQCSSNGEGGCAVLNLANNFSVAGVASTPAMMLTGSWFQGGSSTTTKPQLLIEPAGTTSTGWHTQGTGLGINVPSTSYYASAIDVQADGVTLWRLDAAGNVHTQSATPTSSLGTVTGSNAGGFVSGLTAATAVTITFAASPWSSWASCTATPSVTGITVYNSSQSTASVTFSMAALTGTLYYSCTGN